MVGRQDDWLKVVAAREKSVIDPGILEWAGVAVMKRAYRVYQERGYRLRLLAAAYRNVMQWTELVGGDLVLTMTHDWQQRFNDSGLQVSSRIEEPVAADIHQALYGEFAEYRKAYDEEGLTLDQFDDYGPTRRTLRQFVRGYQDLAAMVRDILLPDPD
jgi:transaldolase